MAYLVHAIPVGLSLTLALGWSIDSIILWRSWRTAVFWVGLALALPAALQIVSPRSDQSVLYWPCQVGFEDWFRIQRAGNGFLPCFEHPIHATSRSFVH